MKIDELKNVTVIGAGAMGHGIVLNAGVGADFDFVHIAAQHDAIPDGGILANFHITDHGNVLRHIGPVDFRGKFLVFFQKHNDFLSFLGLLHTISSF